MRRFSSVFHSLVFGFGALVLTLSMSCSPDDDGPDDACGANGQPCCDGSPCNAGLSCIADTCTPDDGDCGDLNQPCCANDSCEGSFLCDAGVCTESVADQTGKTCIQGSDCASDTCVSIGNGAKVCTTSCNATGDCVPGWQCDSALGIEGNICLCTAEVESCNMLDDDCDGVIDGSGADSSCTDGFVCENGGCVCSLMCDGQCVNPDTDVNNCGSCDMPCPTPPNTSAVCVDAMCGAECLPSFGDCDGNAVNGCEVDLTFSSEHCGYCDRRCLESTCNAGVCNPTVLTPIGSTSNPQGLAIDTTYAYFERDLQLIKIPKIGGTASLLPSTNNSNPRNLAVVGNFVYWTTYQNVKRSNSGGGGLSTLATTSGYPALVVDPTSAYFWDVSAIGKVAVTGGSVTTLVSGVTSLGGMAVDSTHLYFSDLMAKLSRVPISGGAAEDVMTGVAAGALALDATNVYWAGQDGIHKVPKSGGEATLLASESDYVSNMVIDGTHLYWVAVDGSVWKILTEGGEPIKLATGSGNGLGGLAVDGTHVYWVDNTDKLLLKVLK